MPSAVLIGLLLLEAPQAACPMGAETLTRRTADAYQAYVDFDLERFQAQVATIEEGLPCLDEQAAPQQALQLHLVSGLAAWLKRDAGGLNAGLRGVLAIDSGFEPSPDIAPSGSRIRGAFDAARVRNLRRGPGLPCAGLGLVVDGQPAATWLPTDRAALVQLPGAEQDLRSWYLRGQGLPADLEQLVAPFAPAPPPAPRPRSRRLLAAAAFSSLAAGASLAGAYALQARYLENFDQEKEPGMYYGNRVLGITGYSLAGGAGLLAGGALLLWEW